MDPFKTEPTADMRQAANVMWQMFTALVQEGFSAPQALSILGTMLAAQIGGGPKE